MRSVTLVLTAALLVVLGLDPASAEQITPSPETSATAEPAESDATEEPAPEPEPEPEPAVQPAATLDATSYTGYLGTSVTVTGTFTGTDTSTARLARLDGDIWTPLDVTVTTADGAFTASVPISAASSSLRAEVVDADAVTAASEPATLTGTKAASRMSFSMSSRGTDYRSIPFVVSWTTVDGRRPTGQVQLMFKAAGTSTYKVYRTMTVTNGYLRSAATPRMDGRFAVRHNGGTQLLAAASLSRTFDNQPPGKVVTLPKGAPRPSVKLPAQPRHTRAAADATISTISDALWKSMKGRSWHSGCPVGRSNLRVIRVSYWAFDGYVRRGEIVVASKHAAATAKVFTGLYANKTPIRSMYRVDRFGWNSKLRGADDYKSMKADNTSGFNCRTVVGSPGSRSPHSYGKSVDINPWENPYASAKGWTPNGSWQKRSSPASVTWRGRNDPVVKVFRKNGFSWLGGFDLHHFDR